MSLADKDDGLRTVFASSLSVDDLALFKVYCQRFHVPQRCVLSELCDGG